MSEERHWRRIEDPALLTGAGCYASDAAAEPGELVMGVVRSVVAAGSLRALEVAAARAMPGVVAVLTGEDWGADGLGGFVSRVVHPGPEGGPMRRPPFPPLAVGAVHHVGQPLAIVLAETEAAADAAEAVEADIAERAAVTDAEAALAPGAPRVWPELPDNLCFRVTRGDAAAVAGAMAGARRVVRQRLRLSRVTAATLEPRSLRARHDAGSGRFTLVTGTQAPHRVADDLAAVLGVPATALRVVSPACGGSFGLKNYGYPEQALALWAAQRLGRPVRWTASRTEAFLADGHAREQWAEAALALDAQGRLTALEVTVRAALGACLGPSTVHSSVANLGGLAGVYRLPAISVTVEGVFTNTQPVSPYRGAGRPEATYVIERMIDLAAQEIGLDRAELRRRNMIGPGELPWPTPLGLTYDSGDFPAVLARALAAADWAGFEARRAEAAGRNRLRGIGLANPIEIAGGPAGAPMPEFARVELAPDGRVALHLGSSDSGQGHASSFRALVAARLGLPAEGIALIAGDTGLVPRGTGTFGSRTLAAAGTALWNGLDTVIAGLRDTAAGMLEVAPGDVAFAEGRYAVVGTDRSVTLAAVLREHGAPVTAEHFDAAAGATYPNGCHVCEVEIDPETGALGLMRYVVVDDVGRVVNPAIVKGQIMGGVVQGIGQALAEEIRHDPATGQLLSASFMDYAMPRAGDLPGLRVISHPVPTGQNPLGVKGAGEAGTVGALPAVISAVCDALRPCGVRHIDMPATPARIWSALRAAAGPAPGG